MTLWDWMFIFYFVMAAGLTAMWLWKTRTKPRVSDDEPCKCLHPITCDLFDRCMRNEK